MSATSERYLQARLGDRRSGDHPFHFSTPNQDDRLRNVFGLTEEEPIPPVSEETLTAYYHYLVEHLSLPFDALYCQNGGSMRHLIHYVKITGLLEPSGGRNHVLHGLFCTAENHREVFEAPLTEFGVREENPNCQLLDDFAYWFVNWR